MDEWEFETMDLCLPPLDELFVCEDSVFLGSLTVKKKDLKKRSFSVDGIVDAILGLRPSDSSSMQGAVNVAMYSNFEHFDPVLFLLPIRVVAQMCGVAASTVTLRARTFGIPRWPQRRLLKVRAIAHKLSRGMLERAVINAVFGKKHTHEFNRLVEAEYKARHSKNSKISS